MACNALWVQGKGGVTYLFVTFNRLKSTLSRLPVFYNVLRIIPVIIRFFPVNQDSQIISDASHLLSAQKNHRIFP